MSHVTVPARFLCHVPDDIGSFEVYQLSVVADAVTTPYQSLLRSGLKKGDLAVVIGTGGIGGYMVQHAKNAGATVIALDIDDGILERAKKHGAAYVINSKGLSERDIKKQIRTLAKENNLPGIKTMTRVFKKYHAPKTVIEDETSYITYWLITDTAIEATKRAIKKVGYEKMTNKDVKAAMEGLKNYDNGGITHPLSFGEGTEGRRGNKYARVCRIVKGSWKVISPWYKVPFLTGK